MTLMSSDKKTFEHPRLAREWHTVRAMIRLYCHECHGSTGELCPACTGLADYARVRLEKCPFGCDKPTCAKCRIHCYRAKAVQREQMKEVMRYAGPRMIWRHPVLAIRHMMDSRRQAPTRQKSHFRPTLPHHP